MNEAQFVLQLGPGGVFLAFVFFVVACIVIVTAIEKSK